MSENPYEPPGRFSGERPRPSYVPPAEPALGYAWGGRRKNRGGCLTAFLVLMMIANPIASITYLVGGEAVRRGVPHAPEWTFPALAILALANFACAVGMWRWKRWGIVGSLSIAVVTLFVHFAGKVSPVGVMLGLGGPAMLVFLVRPLWRGFD